MQPSDNDKVAIKILGKDFLINCPRETQQELMETAQQLNQRMQAIKTGGKVFGLDRIAIMAALNLTHELISTQQEMAELKQQQQQLNDRIGSVLDNVKNGQSK
ncbi:MAG: cell division protein ZapA [Motiliproteus sp.]